MGIMFLAQQQLVSEGECVVNPEGPQNGTIIIESSFGNRRTTEIHWVEPTTRSATNLSEIQDIENLRVHYPVISPGVFPVLAEEK
jgi:hypothetical protein